MNKILVSINGGVVNVLTSTEECEIAVVDWDDIEAGRIEPIQFEQMEIASEKTVLSYIEEANAIIHLNQ